MNEEDRRELAWARIRVDAALIELRLAFAILEKLRPFDAEQLGYVGTLVAMLRDRLKRLLGRDDAL